MCTAPENLNRRHHPYERFTIWDQKWHDDDWCFLDKYKPSGWAWTYGRTTPFVMPTQNSFVSHGYPTTGGVSQTSLTERGRGVGLKILTTGQGAAIDTTTPAGKL